MGRQTLPSLPEIELKIVLMRHGQSSQHHQPGLSAAEFGGWIKTYDATGIHAESRPPQPAVDQARQCAVAVCSPLTRSLESARALGLSRIDFEFPISKKPLEPLRVPQAIQLKFNLK